MDLIVPAISRDISRLEILAASLQKFWHIPGRRVIAARRHEIDLFRRFEPYFELVAKEEIIGDIPYAAGGPGGWYRQQMVKIGAGRIFNGEYVAIDSDCFACTDLSRGSFLRAGRLPWFEGEWNAAREMYYRGSADAMDLDALPGCAFSWRPPFFFHAHVMRAAMLRMEEKEMAWSDVLSRTPQWGEVMVYHLALGDQMEKLHYQTQHVTHEPIRWPHVDVEADFEAWDVDETFSGEYAFGVIHSNTHIDPARVAAKLKGRF